MTINSLFDDEERAAIQRWFDELDRRTGRPPGPRPVKSTLSRFVSYWSCLVLSLEEGGEDLTLDEYTMVYLKRRDLLEDLADSLGPSTGDKLRRLLRPWDERFLRATKQTEGRPLPYHDEGVDERSRPWWFRLPVVLPKRMGRELKAMRYLK